MTSVLAGQSRLPAKALVFLGLLGAAFLVGQILLRVAVNFGDLAPVAVLALPLLFGVAIAILVDPRVGPFAVIASFPVGASEVPLLLVQLVQLATLAVVALVVIRRLSTGATPLPLAPVMGWVIALLAWMLVALPSAPDQTRATREVMLFAVGLLLASVIVASCRTVGDTRRLLLFLAILVGAIGATTPAQSSGVQPAFRGAVISGRATGVFVDPNQLGTFCAAGSMVAIGLALGAETRGRRLLGAALSLSCVTGLLLSLSRGAWIGFTLGTLILLVKLPEARRWLLALVVPMLLVGAAVGAFAPSSPQVEVVGQRLQSIAGERNPYDNRPSLWREAIRQVSLDPFTGQGPGSFPVVSPRGTSELRTAFAEHAHSIVLTLLAEDGVPAALLATGLAVHLSLLARRVARRARDRSTVTMAAGLAAALAAVMGQGLVDHTLRNTVIVATVFVLIGSLMALDRFTSPIGAGQP